MNRTAQCIVKAAQLRARADKLEKVVRQIRCLRGGARKFTLIAASLEM